MKNKDYQLIINSYNTRLSHFDAKKKVLEQMIKDLNVQYTFASEEWDSYWRERQTYIREHEEELAESK
jgi:hypothetical protein